MQPDAANFNSWRRHIKLAANPPDEIMFAWEDVKAMFNGGSRKRAMAASLTSVSKQQQQSRQQQQQQQQASRLLASEESCSPPPLAPSSIKRPRLQSPSPEPVNAPLLPTSETKTSPSSSGSSSSGQALSCQHTISQAYPFPLIPLHGNKAYGALIQGLTSVPSPFSPATLSHLPSPPPHAPTGLTAPVAEVKALPSQDTPDVRQSFAELMGSSLLLPYNYFHLSRYWPRGGTPAAATAASHVLDMSSRLRFSEGTELTSASLVEKASSERVWERVSQRSSLTHGGSAFKPVSKNLGPKGSAFRAENLIGGRVGCSDSEGDEENEVDVIGEEGVRDRNGHRRPTRESPLLPPPLLVSRSDSSLDQLDACEVCCMQMHLRSPPDAHDGDRMRVSPMHLPPSRIRSRD